LNALLLGLTLLLTVALALGLGIYLGYALISGILHLMGNRHEALPPAPVLAVTQAHGGD
jgi:hypothetical protein